MPPWKVSGWLTIATRNRRQQPAAPWLLRLGGPMVVVVLPLLHRCALRHPAPAVTVLEGRPWVELLWLGRYRQLLRLSQHRQAVGLLATPAVHDAAVASMRVVLRLSVSLLLALRPALLQPRQAVP